MRSTNQGVDRLLEKMDKPQTAPENEAMKRLEKEIEAKGKELEDLKKQIAEKRFVDLESEEAAATRRRIIERLKREGRVSKH